MNFKISAKFLSSFFVFLIFITAGCTPDPGLRWNEQDGYRWAELPGRFFDNTGFRLIEGTDSGISFANQVEDETIRENRHYANGSGVAIGDVTGDGLPDIYFASLEGSNKLYENLGNLQFRDITDEAGVAHSETSSTGVLMLDVNGNGHNDLLITSLDGSNALYLNNGDGTFTLKENSGLGESNGSHSMAAADINGNGFPDLYIANYRLESVRDRYGPEDLSMENTTVTENGQMRIRSEFEDYYEIIEVDGEQLRREKGAEDQLFLNNGDGTFQQADSLQHFPVNIEGESGLFEDWGFTPAFRDLTGDGNPDLYVTNDFWSPDRLWINQGDGIFHALGQEAITNQSYSSMGVDMTDLNKDGLPDIMVTEMLSGTHERRVRQFSDYMGRYQGSTHHNRNSLYLNRGDTTFAQIARFSGLEASEWSWATLFMDVDLDGHEDLLVATGFYRDYLDMDAQQEIARRYEEMGDEMLNRGEFLQFPVLNLSNKAFKNNGDLSFSDLSGDWGFEEEDISMGMAAGDLNNDGTPDLVVNRFNDEAVIYENLTSAPRIVVQLSGTPPNTAGIGASVELTGGPEPQKKEITSGGIYLSDFRKQLVFAATENSDDHSLTVTWRDGSKTVLNNLSANRIYDINQEKTAQLARDEPGQGHESISTPLFKDISESIGHTHEESDYDDFQRVQPLLPKSLSRTGPGIAWVDINDNGLDDLVITGGKGSSAGVFMNNGNGSFS
ncbi:MAG: CRTAC1 family protein, partial [Bacteroidota bacterium]